MAMALPMSIMSVPVAVSAMVAMGATQGAFMAICGTLVQIAAPDELRGRVSSIFLLFAGGLMAWMNLVNGALADVWDAPLLFLLPGAAFLIVLALAILVREPLRRLFKDGLIAPQPEAEVSGLVT
jgi:MFS family permease